MKNEKNIAYLLHYRKNIFLMAALLAMAAACYHGYHPFLEPDETSTLRHCVFVGINILFMVLLIKRPVFFIPLFFLLALQQLFSHGTAFVKRLYQQQFDWISVGQIILLPFFLSLRVLEKKMLANNKKMAV